MHSNGWRRAPDQGFGVTAPAAPHRFTAAANRHGRRTNGSNHHKYRCDTYLEQPVGSTVEVQRVPPRRPARVRFDACWVIALVAEGDLA